MPARFWILLVLALLAGMAVLRSRPRGRRRPPGERERRHVKPVPPPPSPRGPRARP